MSNKTPVDKMIDREAQLTTEVSVFDWSWGHGCLDFKSCGGRELLFCCVSIKERSRVAQRNTKQKVEYFLMDSGKRGASLPLLQRVL
jgi:hypothetical protein